MTTIFGDVLKVLRGIYRPTEDVTAPGRIDVHSPVQFVHDVSREAELGTGLLFQFTADVVHAGNDTQYSSNAAWGQVPAPFSNDRHDLWLMDCSFRYGNSVSAFSTVVAGVQFGDHDWGFSSSQVREAVRGRSNGTTLLAATTLVMSREYHAHFPMYLGEGANLLSRSTSTGAVADTLSVDFTMWVGAKGTTPPGAY